MNYRELSERIYEGNKAKGFWPENPMDRNFNEAIMLVTDELSEAHEAWRCNKRADLLKYDSALKHFGSEYFTGVFGDEIKDTVEDELADTAIRLLDIAYGYNISTSKVMAYMPLNTFPPDARDNMGSKLLWITFMLLQISHAFRENKPKVLSDAWCATFCCILQLCQGLNIDLEKHIELKLKYNATRPHKHGKNY